MANNEYTKDPEAEVCDTCGGAEQIECDYCDVIGMIVNGRGRERKCPKCDGEGYIDCPDCE
jgi:DnaJ-class molecular chaperone